MPLANDALLDQLEHPMKQRFREVLPPRTGMPQGTGQFQVELFHCQGAVRQQAASQVFFAHLSAHFSVKGFGEQGEIRFRQRQAGRHRVATVFGDQIRMLRRHHTQGVADVKALDRTPRALEQTIPGIGKGDGRAEIALFHP
ncbi:hypothetical protein D3C86_1336510 [compost metagenome]